MTDTAQAEVVYDEREQGIYPAVFTGCSNFDYTDAATGQLELRWRWVFADDRGEFDTLTSRSFAPGTNALKFFRGLLGRDPKKGDKPSDSIGKEVQVIYGPNRNGKLTITDVMPLKAK